MHRHINIAPPKKTQEFIWTELIEIHPKRSDTQSVACSPPVNNSASICLAASFEYSPVSFLAHSIIHPPSLDCGASKTLRNLQTAVGGDEATCRLEKSEMFLIDGVAALQVHLTHICLCLIQPFTNITSPCFAATQVNVMSPKLIIFIVYICIIGY